MGNGYDTASTTGTFYYVQRKCEWHQVAETLMKLSREYNIKSYQVVALNKQDVLVVIYGSVIWA